MLITLLSSPSWSAPFDQLIELDGLYYPKFSDVPFNGKVTGKAQGYIKNGRRDGAWVSYMDAGRLMYNGNYKNGLKISD